MLDNLRNQATFEPEEEQSEIMQPEPPRPPKPRHSFDKMTGTTDKQRLMLAIMLFIMMCLLGVILLVITGKWILPIY